MKGAPLTLRPATQSAQTASDLNKSFPSRPSRWWEIFWSHRTLMCDLEDLQVILRLWRMEKFTPLLRPPNVILWCPCKDGFPYSGLFRIRPPEVLEQGVPLFAVSLFVFQLISDFPVISLRGSLQRAERRIFNGKP